MKISLINYFPLAMIVGLLGVSHSQVAPQTAPQAAPADTAASQSKDSAQAQPQAAAPEAAPAPEKAKVDATEKVIVVGYGAMKKKDVVGSVSVVDAKDLKKSNSTSATQALQGKASGVTITHNSGQPGKPVQVRVRGMGSVNNSDPLYVVDGMPTANIEYLNPLDIESIVVLKDASSTSIYGARGANGVILVTTKKGAPGTSKVTYDGTYGLSSPWKKPDLVGAADWIKLHNQALVNGGQAPDTLTVPPGGGTDWWSAVTRKDAVNYGNNFSLTQGDKNLSYYLSGGNTKDEGIIRGSDSKKTTVRANVTARVNSWLSVGNNIGFANTQSNIANEQDEWNSTLITAISHDPVSPIRDASGNLAPATGSGILNPVGTVENNNDFVEANRFKGNVFASVKPINGLELKTNYGLDINHSDSSVFRPKYFISGADQRSAAEVRRENQRQYNWDWENTVSYDFGLGESNFKLLAGATAAEDNYENMLAINTITPTNDPSQRYLSATQGLAPHVEGDASSSALLSYLGRINYDYDLRYFVSLSLRADGSSKFGPANRWGYFPSVGLGWDVSKEGFMKNVSFINYLKLRAGWGVIGNQNIDDYQYTSSTQGSQNYPFGKTVNTGATFVTAGNPDIKWEGQESRNLGFDFTVLNGSIEFTSDFYQKKTNDMLLRVQIPAQAGLRYPPFTNAGDVENKGFDLNLTYRKDIGAFTSKVTGNFSLYRNEVTALGGSGNAIPSVPFRDMGFVDRTEVGHPIASFYGLITDGIFQDSAQVAAYKGPDGSLIQPGAGPGDIRYRDADHDGVPDVGFIGSPHPDFTYGLGIDLGHKGNYGGLDFYLFLQGVQGNQIYNGTRYYTDQTTGFFALDKRMLGAWTPENKHNDVTRPRMNVADVNPNTAISDRYVEDGSYLRIKTITLGYTLPASITTGVKLPEIRVYVGAENLLTLTKYSGFDPEVGEGRFSGSPAANPANEGGLDLGVDRANFPQARKIFTGINVSL
jgi:TonB-linked SusC/RagA family outer membrane protein